MLCGALWCSVVAREHHSGGRLERDGEVEHGSNDASVVKKGGRRVRGRRKSREREEERGGDRQVVKIS